MTEGEVAASPPLCARCSAASRCGRRRANALPNAAQPKASAPPSPSVIAAGGAITPRRARTIAWSWLMRTCETWGSASACGATAAAAWPGAGAAAAAGAHRREHWPVRATAPGRRAPVRAGEAGERRRRRAWGVSAQAAAAPGWRPPARAVRGGRRLGGRWRGALRLLRLLDDAGGRLAAGRRRRQRADDAVGHDDVEAQEERAPALRRVAAHRRRPGQLERLLDVDPTRRRAVDADVEAVGLGQHDPGVLVVLERGQQRDERVADALLHGGLVDRAHQRLAHQGCPEHRCPVQSTPPAGATAPVCSAKSSCWRSRSCLSGVRSGSRCPTVVCTDGTICTPMVRAFLSRRAAATASAAARRGWSVMGVGHDDDRVQRVEQEVGLLARRDVDGHGARAAEVVVGVRVGVVQPGAGGRCWKRPVRISSLPCRVNRVASALVICGPGAETSTTRLSVLVAVLEAAGAVRASIRVARLALRVVEQSLAADHLSMSVVVSAREVQRAALRQQPPAAVGFLGWRGQLVLVLGRDHRPAPRRRAVLTLVDRDRQALPASPVGGSGGLKRTISSGWWGSDPGQRRSS